MNDFTIFSDESKTMQTRHGSVRPDVDVVNQDEDKQEWGLKHSETNGWLGSAGPDYTWKWVPSWHLPGPVNIEKPVENLHFSWVNQL